MPCCTLLQPPQALVRTIAARRPASLLGGRSGQNSHSRLHNSRNSSRLAAQPASAKSASSSKDSAEAQQKLEDLKKPNVLHFSDPAGSAGQSTAFVLSQQSQGCAQNVHAIIRRSSMLLLHSDCRSSLMPPVGMQH